MVAGTVPPMAVVASPMFCPLVQAGGPFLGTSQVGEPSSFISGHLQDLAPVGWGPGTQPLPCLPCPARSPPPSLSGVLAMAGKQCF